MRKRTRVIVWSILIFAVLAVWCVYQNTALEIHTYQIESKALPEVFSGYRIAQVSDLHNAEFGKENAKLLQKLREAAPDLIAITGDLIDSRNTDIEVALRFVKQAMQIAPCYYVSGNHEARVDVYDALKSRLSEIGVTVLENQTVTIEQDGECITVCGVDDPSFTTDYLFGDSKSVMEHRLSELQKDEGYTILLSHRPELFEVYRKFGFDLVLCGHAHGGQIRLPFLGGVIAPHQGFFPHYDAGEFSMEDTTMIVSRGIGNSLFPLRVNNRPEVVLIELN